MIKVQIYFRRQKRKSPKRIFKVQSTKYILKNKNDSRTKYIPKGRNDQSTK